MFLPKLDKITICSDIGKYFNGYIYIYISRLITKTKKVKQML